MPDPISIYFTMIDSGRMNMFHMMTVPYVPKRDGKQAGNPMKHALVAGIIRNILGLILAMFVVVPGATADAPELSHDKFLTLHEQLTPERGDSWRTLPWNTSLLKAVRQATEQKRPVYMLVRSGHPLGCV